MKPSSLSFRGVSAPFAWHPLLAFLFVLLAVPSQAQTPLRLEVKSAQAEPRLVWNSVTGAVYHVLSRASLTTGAWEKAATIVSPGLASEWIDENSRSTTRFYRLLQGEPPLSAQISLVHSSVVSPLLLQTLTNGSYLQARSLLQSVLP
ncbi:MAG: hypothetical protein ACXW32_06425, partial [Limisphaerales bacterium]